MRDYSQHRLHCEVRDNEAQLWAERREGGTTHRECLAVVNGDVDKSPDAPHDGARLAARWNACADALDVLATINDRNASAAALRARRILFDAVSS